MTTEQIIGFSIAIFIMLIGVVGCLLPVLPGTPIILVAAIGHKIYFGETGSSILVLIFLTVLTILSLIFDQLASMIGAKKLGATWKGVTGAVVGGLIGLFFGLPGIILGPFLGATLFEMFGDREFREALKAGAGATIGLLFGVVGKVAVSMVMMGMFTWSVIAHSVEANKAASEDLPAVPLDDAPENSPQPAPDMNDTNVIQMLPLDPPPAFSASTLFALRTRTHDGGCHSSDS
jgi:uncharacterized protein YqgC (DUF456 family)